MNFISHFLIKKLDNLKSTIISIVRNIIIFKFFIERIINYIKNNIIYIYLSIYLLFFIVIFIFIGYEKTVSLNSLYLLENEIKIILNRINMLEISKLNNQTNFIYYKNLIFNLKISVLNMTSVNFFYAYLSYRYIWPMLWDVTDVMRWGVGHFGFFPLLYQICVRTMWESALFFSKLLFFKGYTFPNIFEKIDLLDQTKNNFNMEKEEILITSYLLICEQLKLQIKQEEYRLQLDYVQTQFQFNFDNIYIFFF